MIIFLYFSLCLKLTTYLFTGHLVSFVVFVFSFASGINIVWIWDGDISFLRFLFNLSLSLNFGFLLNMQTFDFSNCNSFWMQHFDLQTFCIATLSKNLANSYYMIPAYDFRWAFRLNAEFFNENKFSLFRIWANQNSAISWFCLPVVRQECILVRVQIHKHWMILVLVRQQLLGQQRRLQLVVRQERRLRLAERLKLRRFTLR